MGSPFLGDFEGVDKETGKLLFSLEANNFVDEVGFDSIIKCELLHIICRLNCSL